MFELYYLVDQNGSIDGDKKTIAYFNTMELAHQRTLDDGMSHYSIEIETSIGASIVFIV